MVAIVKPPYIVAEVCKNWLNGEHCSDDKRLLCEKFELVCNVNASRGYTLESWELRSVMLTTPSGFNHNETIIAVFKRCKPA